MFATIVRREICLKKINGITLVALVVTIVVLLVLAGVAVNLSLGENGLIGEAQTAVDKYKNAQEDEQNFLDSMDMQIANADRSSVTLTEEEYAMFKSQFSKNLDTAVVSINKPNTWIVNKEYNFGDGVYGQRFTGTFTAEANNSTNAKCLNTIPVAGIDSIISIGGNWVTNSSTNSKSSFATAIVTMGSNATAFRCSEVYILNQNIGVCTSSGSDRLNAPYDLWVLYTKN